MNTTHTFQFPSLNMNRYKFLLGPRSTKKQNSALKKSVLFFTDRMTPIRLSDNTTPQTWGNLQNAKFVKINFDTNAFTPLEVSNGHLKTI